MVYGKAVYYCGGPGAVGVPGPRSPQPENRIRALGLGSRALRRHHHQQNIHALDVATWIVGREPLKAVGSCSRKGAATRAIATATFDVVFTFPDGVIVSFASKQFGSGWDNRLSRMFGP